MSFGGDSQHGDPYHSFREELETRIRRVDQLFGRWEDALYNTDTASDSTFSGINTGRYLPVRQQPWAQYSWQQ